MKSNLIKYIAVASFASAVSLGLIFAQKSVAQSTTEAFKGSCGMLLNRNFGGWEAHYSGDTTIAMNFVGIFNFDTQKVSLTYSVVSPFGGDPAVATEQTLTDIPFTLDSGPFSGSYYVTVGGSKVFTFVPVNQGNSYLIVEKNNQAIATGVCQKI